MAGEPHGLAYGCLLAASRDVRVVNLLRLLHRVASEVVGVPHNAFVGHLRMIAQELQCVDRRRRVVILVGEARRFKAGFFLLSHPPVEDGQVVVGGQIVWINPLQALVNLPSLGVIVLLVVADSEFAQSVF